MALTTDTMIRHRSYENRTYCLSDTKIEGYVDGLAALKQAVLKVLSTDRCEYPIYSFRYGVAFRELAGEERSYVRAELRRMVREVLLRDDRILDVDHFSFAFSGDICICTFDVSSIYGNLAMELEVAV